MFKVKIRALTDLSQTMLLYFQANRWIGNKTDEKKSIEEFLPFVYTRDNENPEAVHIKSSGIDEGTFLGPHN